MSAAESGQYVVQINNGMSDVAYIICRENFMSNEYFDDLSKRLKKFADDRDWDQFHAPKNLVMALSVEAAELTEHFQWLTEEQSNNLSKEKLDEVAYEMADIFIYLTRLATKLDVDLPQYVEDKIKINEEKYPAEKVKGSSKKYNQYD